MKATEITFLYLSVLKTKIPAPPGPPGGLHLCLCVCPEGKWEPGVERTANALPHPLQKILNIISLRLIGEWLKHNA